MSVFHSGIKKQQGKSVIYPEAGVRDDNLERRRRGAGKSDDRVFRCVCVCVYI